MKFDELSWLTLGFNAIMTVIFGIPLSLYLGSAVKGALLTCLFLLLTGLLIGYVKIETAPPYSSWSGNPLNTNINLDQHIFYIYTHSYSSILDVGSHIWDILSNFTVFLFWAQIPHYFLKAYESGNISSGIILVGILIYFIAFWIAWKNEDKWGN